MSKEEMQRRQLGASQARERRLRDENKRLGERVASLEAALRETLSKYKGAAEMADSALNGSAYMREAEEWDGALREIGLEV